MERAQPHSRGFLLVAGLLAITAILTLSAAGLTRSLTELTSANRFISNTQAFHMAESGLDEALQQLGRLSHDQLNAGILGLAQNCSVPGCAFTIDDEQGPQDTDWLVRIRATGALPGARSQTITASVQLPISIFDNGVMAWKLYLRDSARVGNTTTQVPTFFITGLVVDLSTTMWPTTLRFHEPFPYCPQCGPPANPAVFPNSPLMVTGSGGAQALPEDLARIDLTPYWTAAQAQTSTDCLGRNYHVISSGTFLIDGSNCPGGVQVLNGVIYVEKDANLDFAGNVILNGTIAHEGFQWADPDQVAPYSHGRLRVRNRANVTIDSYAGASPFAGAAIVGQPVVEIRQPQTVVLIKGFVMVGGDSDSSYRNRSVIGGQTRIDGGMFVMCDGPFFPLALNTPGPGIAGPIRFSDKWNSLHDVVVKDQAVIAYDKPPVVPVGFPVRGGATGVRRPTIRFWRME